jgi:L-threonylcarbamoyladenylate synthase
VSDGDVGEAARMIGAGGTAVVPTDTVYGLAGTGYRPDGAAAVYALKGRAPTQPTALVVASVELLLELLPELDDRARRVVRALLPGPFTLVLPNPAHRFSWLAGGRPEAIGVRVPAVSGPGRAVLDAVGALVATSANLPGGPEPRSLSDVPDRLLQGAGAVVDGGTLPGTPSTVVDVTRETPLVLREGAVSSAETLQRIGRALAVE